MYLSILQRPVVLTCISQTLDDATATKLAGENPDYATESLFETIESGNFPSWTVYIVGVH